MKDQLYAITVISNPRRFKSRYDLYRKFEKYIQDSGVILYTVEIAYGDRDHAVTQSNNPCHIQLRSKHELWHKENMINIGVSRLPSDWKYMAWIDADIMFTRSDWAEETVQMLQHHQVVQMFSHAEDLGPNNEPLKSHNGFVFCYSNMPKGSRVDSGYGNWHPGYAWAIRRDAFDAVGGLFDYGIVGSGDRHMACALIGQVSVTFYPDLEEKAPDYMKLLNLWQQRAEKYINRDIGYVPGLLIHSWHGKKKDRGYKSRWSIVTDNYFSPFVDIIKDWQGVWQLTDTKPTLRDDIRKYFSSRNEDSIDL